MKKLRQKKTTRPIDDQDRRFRAVAYFPQTDTFLVTFLDGRAYHLPRAAFAADLEFDHTSPVSAVTVGADLDYYFTIRFASGATFDVPWDRVLHECEPAYEYFKGRRLKQDRADLVSEAQRVRRLDPGRPSQAGGTSTSKPRPGGIGAVSAVARDLRTYCPCTGPAGEHPRFASPVN
jgi:hypothetical protein